MECPDAVDRSVVAALAAAAPRCATLDLGGSSIHRSLVSDGMAEEAAAGLAALTALGVSYSSRITDKGVAAIFAARGQTLQAFVAEDVPLLTDAGLAAVGAHAAALRRCRLDYCKEITAAGVKELAACPALENLSLDACTKLGDDLVGAFDGGFKALKRLNLGDIVAMGSISLDAANSVKAALEARGVTVILND